MKDLKAALGNRSKPDITHVRKSVMTYIARGCEYGNDVYERANYLLPVEGTKAAFERHRAYLRAAVSHLAEILDGMERHQSLDPQLLDNDGMRTAMFAADHSASQTAIDKGVGPSKLPHIAHAAASIMMAIEQLVLQGHLPADPGSPWTAKAATIAGEGAAARATVADEVELTDEDVAELTSAIDSANSIAELNASFGANKMPDEMSDGVPVAVPAPPARKIEIGGCARVVVGYRRGCEGKVSLIDGDAAMLQLARGPQWIPLAHLEAV